MANLGHEASRLIAQMNPDAAKFLKAAKNRDAYVRAAQCAWRDNEAAARLVLAHTNAFYVRRDERPRKGPDKDKPYMLGEICIDDPVIRSDVNARRELLKLELAYGGIHVDEVRIIPAKMGMKERHPFAEIAKLGFQGADMCDVGRRGAGRAPEAALKDDEEGLVALRRVLCLVFGEKAHIISKKVASARLEPVRFDGQAERRTLRQSYWMHVYTDDSQLVKLMKTYEREIISRSREIGINVRAIQFHCTNLEKSTK